MSPKCLRRLRDIGFPVELPDIRARCTAAKARVCRFENRQHGGLRVQERTVRLQQAVAAAAGRPRAQAWRAWLDNLFLFQLARAETALKAECARPPCSPSLYLPSASGIDHVGWQARATKLLRARPDGAAFYHLRRKLDRWSLPTLPGRRVARVVSTFKTLATHAPPRVLAAALRTVCNGWVTTRRFPQAGVRRCVLGCPRGEDSIEHYAGCECFHQLCRRHLGLSTPPRPQCLDDFLGVAPYLPALPALFPAAEARAACTVLRALAVFALYRVHGNARHGSWLPAELQEAFPAFVREAAQGHPKTLSFLALARRRPRDVQ